MGGYNSGSLSNTYWIDGTPFDYNPGGWGIDDPKMHFYTGSGNWGTWCNTCTTGGICQRWDYQTTGCVGASSLHARDTQPASV